MQFSLDILVVILVFVTLIGFHEFGHLLAAKLSKIPVEKFSIGFGPAIVKWKRGETEYQISAIPLGGYNKFRGEDFDDPEGFFSFPFGRKAITTAAGIIANLALSLVLYFIIGLGWGMESPHAILDFPKDSPMAGAGFVPGDSVMTVNGVKVKDYLEFAEKIEQEDKVNVSVFRNGTEYTLTLPKSDSLKIEPMLAPVIGHVLTKTPADRAGMKSGDRVISIDSTPVSTWSQLVGMIKVADTSKVLEFVWFHKGDTIKAKIKPEHSKLTGSRGIGVLVNIPTRPLTFGEVLWLPVQRTALVTAQTCAVIVKLIIGKESVRNLGGPILIAQLSAQTRRMGFENLLGLIALLSISLAVINLVPIPLMDGGRILIFLIEKISRRRFGKKVWTITSNIGLILVIALLGLSLFNDIFRIVSK